MIGRHTKAEVSPVWFQVGRRRGRHRCGVRRLRRRQYHRMQACRERKGVFENPDRYACSRLCGHTQLTLPATSLRRQLLNKSVAGIGVERQPMFAAKLGTAQRRGKVVGVITDDDELRGLLRRAVPAINGLGGEHTVVVDDEVSWHVSQKGLYLRQLPEEPIRRILEDE